MAAFLSFISIIQINVAFQRTAQIGLKQTYRNIEFEAVSIKDPTLSLNVRDYGAKGDSVTDDTAAFTSAFSAATKQGGAIVFAPVGQYVFQGQLIIPSGVSLVGSYITVPSHSFPKTAPTDGTILMPYYGRGLTNETQAFIQILSDASLKGVVIYYPEQKCANEIPARYPPTIFMHGNNAAAQDIELLNSYIGIWAVGAHRHYIARIQGQPLYIGVFVDETYDIGRMEDIHFNPWFCNQLNYLYTQTQFGRSFVLGRSDWEYVFNTFSFGYAIGYHFIETSTGSMNGNFVGIGADYACNASVQIDAAQPAGLLIVNGEFTSFHDKKFAPNNTFASVQVIVNKKNSGPVVFSSCSFWGPSQNIARLYGASTTTFQGSQFVTWNQHHEDGGEEQDAPAIYANNGNLIVDACTFQYNATQIQLDKGAKKAIITNNILKDGAYYKIDSSVKTAISNNL